MRFARQLILPAALCAVCWAGALAMAIATRTSGSDLLGSYLNVGMTATVMGVLLWVGVPWLRSRDHRHLDPTKALPLILRERWPLLLLPFLLSPLFMAGFTVMKVCLPFMTGYHWDVFWTEADAVLFGTDPWRVTHALIGPRGSELMAHVYTLIWGTAMTFILPIYVLSGRPDRVINAYSALMMIWLVGGVGGTAIFSSMGPVFADMADASLADRFAPLRASLIDRLGGDDGAIILTSQDYLRRTVDVHHVFRAAGVSAMPSMHIATSAFLVMLAGRTLWRWPAMALLVTMWVGSVHFGYHYALDGIVGAAITWICWRICVPDKRATANVTAPVLQPA